MICCHLTAQLTKKATSLHLQNNGCISSLVRQQNGNQDLSFSTLLSESCQGCHSTLMSKFPPRPRPPSQLCLMNFQSVRPSISTLFPAALLLFLYHLWPIPVLLPRLLLRAGMGGKRGDGRWSVCTFSGKLKYSCMCACVAV